MRAVRIIGLLLLAVIGAGGGYFWWTTTVKDLPPGTLNSDASVTVVATAYGYAIDPAVGSDADGMVFIAGAFVPAMAYVPFARALASAGHPTRVIGLEMGVAQLPGQQDGLKATIASLLTAERAWTVGGHSLGSYYASQYAVAHSDAVAGLFMAGTGNPYIDLSGFNHPVTVINGSSDNIVNSRDDTARAAYLPPDLEAVTVEGGNHAGFAYYGPQLGDGGATVSKAEQQNQMTAAALALFVRSQADQTTARLNIIRLAEAA